MNTPLYKSFKSRGTSLYVFPSAAEDLNLSTFQNLIKMNFTKFVLLDIPAATTYIDGTYEKNVLKFSKTSDDPLPAGVNFYNFDPNPLKPDNFSEWLTESLRNYVANYDATFRNSKISNNKNYYNVSETQTPTEKIFWKWCKKLNLIDFEPALHKIDWDKNLPDFDNKNANTYSDPSYFRKYLWKERDVNIYTSGTTVTKDGLTGNPIFTVGMICKLKIGDYIQFSGVTGTGNLSGQTDYKVVNITYPSATSTEITVNHSGVYVGDNDITSFYLSYHQLVKYIGEIQATSKVQASQQNFTEFTAMIPAHCGKSPTVLFKTEADLNYYTNLELPIMLEQIQPEILGAEYLASPIRTNPSDYPGSFYGYFDTIDKTYITSSGDQLRLNGGYFGILLSTNEGLNSETYFEKLTDFNSDNLDGLCLDFDYKHYYKMNIPGQTVTNFDEFNSTSVNNNPPEDFQFNAILWYYEIITQDGTVKNNLFGIEFMNNPEDDFGSVNDKLITPLQKLVSTDTQDGLSYIFNLNLDFKVDNDMLPLKYDPTSIYNVFGFDLYNNIMSNYGKLNESFLTIISEFIRMNQEMMDLKSLVWSQIDIDIIKKRLDNFDYLLKLYSTFQVINTDSVKVEVDYTKVYPALKLHAKTVDYEYISNLYSNDILLYSLMYSGSTVVSTPQFGRFLVNIFSNVVTNFTGQTLSVVLDKDLDFKQSCDIVIRPDLSVYTNKLNVYLMYDDGYSDHNLQQKTIMENIYLPVNVLEYDVNNPTGSTLNDAQYYNISSYVSNIWVNTPVSAATIEVNNSIFKSGDYAYIDNFYLQSGTTSTINDFSGLYYLSGLTSGVTNIFRLSYNPDTILDLRNTGYVLPDKTYPKISYYLGVKINILRISDDIYSDMPHRYSVSKTFLTSDSLLKLDTNTT